MLRGLFGKKPSQLPNDIGKLLRPDSQAQAFLDQGGVVGNTAHNAEPLILNEIWPVPDDAVLAKFERLEEAADIPNAPTPAIGSANFGVSRQADNLVSNGNLIPIATEFATAAAEGSAKMAIAQDYCPHSNAVDGHPVPESSPAQDFPVPSGTAPPSEHPNLHWFDEAFYLGVNPDVAEAVQRGDFQSGLMHYAIARPADERLAWPVVDLEWYETHYPLAAQDVASGLARNIEDHYHRIGRFRGYVSSATAARPENPAPYRSRYGGLWTDQGNAIDVLQGKSDLGVITEVQAALLRDWIDRGYVVLPRAIPSPIVVNAELDIQRAFRGLLPDLRFCRGDEEPKEWVPQVTNGRYRALDLHWYSASARNLIFAPSITAFLHLIFERRVMVGRTDAFWCGQTRGVMQDSAQIGYSLPMQFVSAWTPLDPPGDAASGVTLFPGSHRMAEYRYHHRFKNVEEAARMGLGGESVAGQQRHHAERITLQLAGLDLHPATIVPNPGDVVIWSADMVWRAEEGARDLPQKSMLTRYGPAEIAPACFEGLRPTIRQHGATAVYTSCHYDCL